jgi:hypothetical protein
MVSALFNTDAIKMAAAWNNVYFADNTKSKELLKIDYNPDFGQCLKDMVYSMVDTGCMKDPTKVEKEESVVVEEPENNENIEPEEKQK